MAGVFKSRFVKKSLKGLVLTGWANKHVDRCCLRFEKHFIQKNAGLYVFGRINYDADYVKQTLFYLEDTVNQEALDELEAEEAYISAFPDNFKDGFFLIHNHYSQGLTIREDRYILKTEVILRGRSKWS